MVFREYNKQEFEALKQEYEQQRSNFFEGLMQKFKGNVARAAKATGFTDGFVRGNVEKYGIEYNDRKSGYIQNYGHGISTITVHVEPRKG